MPIHRSQRPLTDEERTRLLTFREQPRPLRWLGGALLLSLLFAGCSGAILTKVIQALLEIKETARPYGFGIAAIVVFILAGLFANGERRARRQRAQTRRRIADHNLVEITTIDFDRLWTIVGIAGGTEVAGAQGVAEKAGDKGSAKSSICKTVVLEARPFILVHIPVPADEDEHAAIVSSLHAPHEPAPTFNGTFPRRTVIIEHARGPAKPSPADRSILTPDSLLLTVSWTGERMTPAGEAPQDCISSGGWWDDDDFIPSPLGIGTLTATVPQLARGPWMKESS